MDDHPKLRALEAIPVQDGGEMVVLLRDPSAISGQTLAVPGRVYNLLAMLDGQRSLVEIQEEYARRFRRSVSMEQLDGLVKRLDGALFLDNDRFEEAKRRAVDSFRKLRVRPAAHAGAAYDMDPDVLTKRLAGFFSDKGGPGGIGEKPSGALAGLKGRRLLGALAPHIDPGRGRTSYAWTYKALAALSDVELFVVLGTAHQMCDGLYVPLDMDFDTPLGIVETDRDFMGRLGRRYPLASPDDTLVHRSEHSIEFQALFLRHVMGARAVRIAPVLCSSLLRFVDGAGDPMRVAEVSDFVGALKDVIAESGRSVCVLGGVDLAHLGPKFGHEYMVQDAELAEAREDDLRLLKPVAAGDGLAFWRAIAADEDSRNVCGATAIYTLLQVIAPCEGRLLDYGQAPEPETKSAVTFASMVFVDAKR